MSPFRHRLYRAVTFGHFTVDVFGSTGPVLVTFLSIPMGLSAAQIGLAIGTFQLIAALTQPLFGWLTDRLGSRWFGSVSVPWMVAFMMLTIAVAHTGGSFWLFMTVFSLAAVGSGAFHPQGAMHAATATTSRAATATAIFFLFGQSGLATGPVLAGLILDNLGLGGFYGLGLLSVPVMVFMALAMQEARPPAEPAMLHPARVMAAPASEPMQWRNISLLAVLIGLRSWTFLGTVAFLPKMFQTMGWTATSYGLITGTYWIASAVAGVVVGNLADRWGRRYVIFATLLLGSIPIYFLPITGHWPAFPLAIAAGALLGGSNSIFVVIAQALLPGRKALASGATMGYMFGVGALAVWGIGALADVWPLAAVIQAGAGIGLLGALAALLLPATRAAAVQPQAEQITA